ncbi:uncharacterized protein LOC128932078 [Callithrix jacchus]|uniref:collagen alpha-1(I) chain-like n=1 Tax=Callithrix jacchus TaxID=9483 RepID=UPI0023DD1F3E|nr:collagen alpha-1(I) chain-like [Callithrix jacchus]XP_054111586.1 collagen alpha-1(I) chain-like [Callithrix jacchus]XP_054111587.1 collagen alpha-1(I) chain-like [Callithrix jacchus]XP_054111588.1 collagen alpha-1(I) chain-like [Callithrix jacchus]XP_054111589.1 collagen alpha-1(I) chain-like [Callithrix jacchus]XP_054111590.1 collagen alpha-1(I) chain-like [Callithrix jacchus]XP_054111592.1 collagen alpha-1(I) chain-like [Callithrix jacchus]XP_054111593.1 collagen alpha-1(I) chain-like 
MNKSQGPEGAREAGARGAAGAVASPLPPLSGCAGPQGRRTGRGGVQVAPPEPEAGPGCVRGPKGARSWVPPPRPFFPASHLHGCAVFTRLRRRFRVPGPHPGPHGRCSAPAIAAVTSASLRAWPPRHARRRRPHGSRTRSPRAPSTHRLGSYGAGGGRTGRRGRLGIRGPGALSPPRARRGPGRAPSGPAPARQRPRNLGASSPRLGQLRAGPSGHGEHARPNPAALLGPWGRLAFSPGPLPLQSLPRGPGQGRCPSFHLPHRSPGRPRLCGPERSGACTEPVPRAWSFPRPPPAISQQPSFAFVPSIHSCAHLGSGSWRRVKHRPPLPKIVVPVALPS